MKPMSRFVNVGNHIINLLHLVHAHNVDKAGELLITLDGGSIIRLYGIEARAFWRFLQTGELLDPLAALPIDPERPMGVTEAEKRALHGPAGNGAEVYGRARIMDQ